MQHIVRVFILAAAVSTAALALSPMITEAATLDASEGELLRVIGSERACTRTAR